MNFRVLLYENENFFGIFQRYIQFCLFYLQAKPNDNQEKTNYLHLNNNEVHSNSTELSDKPRQLLLIQQTSPEQLLTLHENFRLRHHLALFHSKFGVPRLTFHHKYIHYATSPEKYKYSLILIFMIFKKKINKNNHKRGFSLALCK